MKSYNPILLFDCAITDFVVVKSSKKAAIISLLSRQKRNSILVIGLNETLSCVLRMLEVLHLESNTNLTQVAKSVNNKAKLPQTLLQIGLSCTLSALPNIQAKILWFCFCLNWTQGVSDFGYHSCKVALQISMLLAVLKLSQIYLSS